MVLFLGVYLVFVIIWLLWASFCFTLFSLCGVVMLCILHTAHFCKEKTAIKPSPIPSWSFTIPVEWVCMHFVNVGISVLVLDVIWQLLAVWCYWFSLCPCLCLLHFSLHLHFFLSAYVCHCSVLVSPSRPCCSVCVLEMRCFWLGATWLISRLVFLVGPSPKIFELLSL